MMARLSIYIELLFAGLIFTLLQSMCRKLYRNSKVSFEILKILLKIMEPLCMDDSDMKQNCFIMIKSYLQLCEDMYYPPKVASVIYECITKIILMNQSQNTNIVEAFEDAFMKKVKGNIHSIRLHCCYLMKLINNFSEDDIETFSMKLLDIFLIDVSLIPTCVWKIDFSAYGHLSNRRRSARSE